MMTQPRVLIHTLGCKVNQADAGALAAALSQNGCVAVSRGPAHAVVVNTCVVTTTAEAKSRQAIRRLRRLHPGALIVCAGCAPRGTGLTPASLPEVDLALTGTPVEIAARIALALNARPVTVSPPPGRTRALLKVQEGCAEFCSYCIVPHVRGRPISVPGPSAVRQARDLIQAGYREIVICGTNLGCYGTDLEEASSLERLLASLLELPGDVRFRISSVEPMNVTPSLARMIAKTPRLCRHLHLVLQSGSDRVLRLMGRNYTTEEFSRIVSAARETDPACAITTDIIVGFPGETTADHERSLELVSQTGFSRLHVFPYSPRPGTTAADLPGRLSARELETRAQEMTAVGTALAEDFARSLIGSQASVLVERITPRGGEGLTDNYVRATIPAYPGRENEFVVVRITRTDGVGVIA